MDPEILWLRVFYPTTLKHSVVSGARENLEELIKNEFKLSGPFVMYQTDAGKWMEVIPDKLNDARDVRIRLEDEPESIINVKDKEGDENTAYHEILKTKLTSQGTLTEQDRQFLCRLIDEKEKLGSEEIEPASSKPPVEERRGMKQREDDSSDDDKDNKMSAEETQGKRTRHGSGSDTSGGSFHDAVELDISEAEDTEVKDPAKSKEDPKKTSKFLNGQQVSETKEKTKKQPEVISKERNARGRPKKKSKLLPDDHEDDSDEETNARGSPRKKSKLLPDDHEDDSDEKTNARGHSKRKPKHLPNYHEDDSDEETNARGRPKKKSKLLPDDHEDDNEEGSSTKKQSKKKAKPGIDPEEEDEHMKSTFEDRRELILSTSPTIKTIENLYPSLFDKKQLIAEFGRVTSPEIADTFYGNLRIYSPAIISCAKSSSMKTMVEKAVQKAKIEKEKTYAKFAGALLLLPTLLKEDIVSIVDFKCTEIPDTDNPIIACECTVRQMFQNEPLFKVYAEQVLLDDTGDFNEAVLVLMASFYCFNMEYPDTFFNSAKLIEILLLDIDDGDDLPKEVELIHKKILKHKKVEKKT